MTPKEYYKNYQADDKVGMIGDWLLVKISLDNPIHILEFGCGTGKHLTQLHKRGISTLGIDISPMNVITAMTRHNLPFVVCSDETYLRNICNIDVVFTVSVLDHIENIDGIIGEFKRIANKCIYLAETNDSHIGEHYFKHDYESYGFEKMDFEWIGQDGGQYFVWRWEKPLTVGQSFYDYAIELTQKGIKEKEDHHCAG